MGVLRTFLVGLALTSAAPAAASDDLVRFFATCAGRLSAEMEFRWLLQRPIGDITRERAEVVHILDAIRPADAGPRVLAWRIEAKLAQSALLTRSAFNADADDARWASGRAETELSHCRARILAGGITGAGA